MAEHRGPRLVAGPVLDLLGQQVAYATKSDMAELVKLARSDAERTLLGSGPFGHYDDTGMAAAHAASLEPLAHLSHVERLLRDEDVGRSPGNS